MFAFEFNDVNTLVVQASKVPEIVKLTAVAVPVKAGLAKGAFKFKAVVVAFSPKAVNTLVAPTNKLPETVKSTAVAAPVKIGLAKRFDFSCAITPPYKDSHVKDPQVKSVVIVILFEVKFR